jgi:hypothetical protein
MRRLIAMIVLLAGLFGAGSSAIACTAGAAGDCCPAGAPSGCSQGYEQLELAATACCLTGSASSPIVSAESNRGLQALPRDCGSPDPVASSSIFALLADAAPCSQIDATIVRSSATDRSLTYLHTGRLRL